MTRARMILTAIAFLAAGCATAPRPVAAPATQPRAIAPATRATGGGPKSDLALADIEPRPVMPTTAPATHASTPPPLEALELFAQARRHLDDGERSAAIKILEQAIKLDSESYELWFALGQACAGVGAASEKSIAAFERAAKIDPDRLELQTDLGRQYLAKGDLPKALEHLRLALQTKKYKQDDDGAAITDFYLAKALQQAGYDRAALEEYDRLLDRLERPVVSLRGVPELAMVIREPDKLFIQVGELYAKRGEQESALRAFEMAAAHRPMRLDYQQRVIRSLMSSGQQDRAAQRAAEVVRQFRASPDSLKLLNEVYKDAGGEEAAVDALTQLHREQPDDHAFMFALANLLVAQNRVSDAEELFAAAAARSKYDFDIVRRAFALYSEHDDVESAARLLTQALATQPEALHELLPMWQELLRPSRKRHLRLTAVQAMEVPPQAQAAKLFWIAWIGQAWSRDAAARTALEQAVKLSPPFAPAYRLLHSKYWLREDWDDAKKAEATQALIKSAADQGDEVLASELRGLLLLNQKQAARAIEHFAKAVRLGGTSPDLQLEYAMTLRANGQNARAEQMLWKLIADRPMCEDAYASLFRYYLDAKAPQQALRVLAEWRKADPDSVNAKLLEASVALSAGQPAAAEAMLNDLFQHDADNADVLNNFAEYYRRQGRLDQWVARLEAERTKHPENRMAVEQLVAMYTVQQKTADANRVLAAAREGVADEPDLLYYIAGLYTRVGQKDVTEKILQEVLKLDPMHAPASNDLGYNWADAGKNLEQAEKLIRIALQGEPDNGAFLDSLGWVLYKRGQFAEARKYFELAVAPASLPDPVVLDHLGDSLYRLGQRGDALRQWRRSWDRLGQMPTQREELKELRSQLQQKIKAVDAGQPANVAPTADAQTPQQAKKQ